MSAVEETLILGEFVGFIKYYESCYYNNLFAVTVLLVGDGVTVTPKRLLPKNVY